MTSLGNEETLFLQELRKEISEIPGLARWIDPRFVVVDQFLEDALDKHVFSEVLIVIWGSSTKEDPHSLGASGDLLLSANVTVVVAGSEDVEPEPSELMGQPTSEKASLSMIDGFLRNGLKDGLLGGLAWDTELTGGDPVTVPKPEKAVARQYVFTAYREVER